MAIAAAAWDNGVCRGSIAKPVAASSSWNAIGARNAKPGSSKSSWCWRATAERSVKSAGNAPTSDCACPTSTID